MEYEEMDPTSAEEVDALAHAIMSVDGEHSEDDYVNALHAACALIDRLGSLGYRIIANDYESREYH